MKRWIALSLLSLLVLSVEAGAAPLTMKELAFLVRQRTPEAQIIAEVQKRRLMVPLDAATAEALKQNGASETLVKSISAPEFVISAEQAQAEQQRQMAQRAEAERSLADDAAASAALEEYRRKVAGVNASRGKMADIFDGKLVKLNGNELAAFSARELAHVRVFGVYQSSKTAESNHKFTSQLVAAYKRLKEQYRDQFEIIFVSKDQDEFNMQNYMRAEKMPWPAIQFGKQIEQVNDVLANGAPWLVAVNSAAQPMTQNGLDKKFIPPDAILGAIEELLAKGMR